MIQLVNLLNENLWNFELITALNGDDWWINLQWKTRQRKYFMDFGYSPTDKIVTNVPCLVNVQINKNFLHALPGYLFFYSSNPRITQPDDKTLGQEVKLLYYN